MAGVLEFPTQVDGVPEDVLTRLAAHGREADRQETNRDWEDDYGRRGLHLTYRFPSAERMCAFGAREALAHPRAHLVDGHGPDHEWSGAALPAALWMGAMAGWPDAVPLATDVYDRLTAKRLTSRIPVPVMLEEPGDEVDVASHLSGDDAFVGCAQSLMVGVGRGSVVLRHNLFVTAYESVESIVQRGAVAAAIVHLLETSGTQVAIDLDMYAEYGGNTLDLECRIKDFGVPMDLPRIVYWLAHPSALRRVVFAVTARDFKNHICVPHDDAPDVVRIGSAMRGGDVMEMAQKTLAAAGIELEG